MKIERAQPEAAPPLVFVRSRERSLGEPDSNAADWLRGPRSGALAHEIEREVGRIGAIEQVERGPRPKTRCDEAHARVADRPGNALSIGGFDFEIWQEYALFFTLPISALGFLISNCLGNNYVPPAREEIRR